MIRHVYLDYNSTTPIDPRVAEELTTAYAAGYVNPASQHRAGQHARRKLENCRRNILLRLGANAKGMDHDDLVFTSGGTEANHLALVGPVLSTRPTIALCGLEHPSVWETARSLQRQGRQLAVIPVGADGICRLDVLQNRLAQGDIGLVTLMLANNETGVIQPVAEMSQMARSAGAMSHCDAVQAVGKIPVSFNDLGVDMLSFAAHKFYGPRGIGGLVIRSGVKLAPVLYGGFQQKSLRPGTEDVALALGCQKALDLAVEEMPWRQPQLRQLSAQFLELLQQQIFGPWELIGKHSPRLEHTLNLAFPGIDRQALLLACDLAGIYFSTGSACASGSSDLSPVLQAMGLADEFLQSAVRISLGWPTTSAEIEFAASKIAAIVNNFRSP